MFTVTCPRCQHAGSVLPQHLGKRVKCSRCGGQFVPAAGGDASRRSTARRRSARPWAVVAVVLVCLLALGAGGSLLAWLAVPGAEGPPEGPSAKAEPKARRPVADKVPPQGKAPAAATANKGAGETAPPKAPANPPAPVAKPSPAVRNDAQFLVLSELDKQLATYHKLIKPQPGEWKFAEVPWVPTVWEARKKAAEEGKPMFIWYMAGEPLGQC
jgi:ribosomal protein S27E